MMKMLKSSLILGILTLLVGSAWGANGNITGITVSPANPSLKKSFEITVQGTVVQGKTCSIVFVKGDGTPQSLVGNTSSFPFKFGGQPYPLFIYDKPGTYTIKVFSNNCTGEGKATVSVIGKVAVVQPAMVLQNPCPQGWHKKSGTGGPYTCVPNMPIQKPVCPPGTHYFETECTLGCSGGGGAVEVEMK